MPLIRGHGPYSQQRGMLSLERLRVEVGEGEVDTVILAFTDMQGRLQGKRLSAEYYLDDVVPNHAEGCNYLLAVDVDMNTVDGYEMSSWEHGYGDFVLRPDFSTLRRVPWLPATALVLANLTWLDGSPGWTCRWMCVGRRFSNGSGARCARFPRVQRRAMRK